MNAIAKSPYWNESAIIITYDETDGLYDHVPEQFRTYGPDGQPETGGPRIPAIVISPYASAHAVSHVYSEHSSVIQFIDELFSLVPLADLPDEAQARTTGANSASFNGPNGAQQNLGPADDPSKLTNYQAGMGDLLEAFDDDRLKGNAPLLPASYATIDPKQIAIIPMPFQEEGEMDDAMSARHCDAISAYVSKLAVLRSAYARQLGGDAILHDWLTVAPVAPAYRQGDAAWAMLVDWTIYALLQAEASGVTRETVGAMRDSQDPLVRRLSGQDWASSRAIGLQDHEWAAKVIAVVGNYGEIYDRTVGAQSALRLPRGRNALWTQGGLMVPLPVQ